jgi:uncharacterized lipoprotein
MRNYALAALAVVTLSACSSATIEKAVKDGADSAKSFAVRTTAESLGLELQREAASRGLPATDPTILDEVLKRFPGVTVSTVQNGKVTVTLLEKQACLTLATADAPSSATSGPCA